MLNRHIIELLQIVQMPHFQYKGIVQKYERLYSFNKSNLLAVNDVNEVNKNHNDNNET